MKTIWKFPLVVTQEQEINMPRGGEILTVQTQYNGPCVWAIVDPDQPVEPRRLRMFGTGHPFAIDAPHRHIGTFQSHGGSLIFHVFEVI